MQNVKRQSTLKSPVSCSGIELHGGNHTHLMMRPAPVNSGLVFIRTDITDRDNRVIVAPENVSSVKNCTTIQNAAGVKISTIEHLLAALAATGIDNLYLELDGQELPALDGSAEPFLKLIEQAGLKRQNAPRRYVEVLKPVEVQRGEAFARFLPAPRLSLSVSIDFKDKAIGQQKVEIVPNVADEFVRHKALDLLGDIYLGGPILGRVETHASGHGLNHALLIALYGNRNAWRFVSLSEDGISSPRHEQALLQTVLA